MEVGSEAKSKFQTSKNTTMKIAVRYTIEMEKETLYENINQGKDIAEMNAVVLFQTKLNAGMSSGMWTCEYQTTRQSLIEFTCLYSMHDPSPLDYQVFSPTQIWWICCTL